jgi:uncharacterized protein (TIGR00369 family)
MQPERTRTFSWADPLIAARAAGELSGFEVIQAIKDGELPPPPIASLLDFRITHVERGRVIFALSPAEWMYNPIGSVHGGIASTLLDSALGCSIHTMLDAGARYTTSDLHVRFVRPMRADTGPVVADCHVVHVGRRLATAEGTLVAQDGGTLLAHATTGCLIL